MLNKKGFQDRRSPFLFFMNKIMFKNVLKMRYTKKHQKIINF